MSYLLTSMEEVRKENEKKQRILELKEAIKKAEAEWNTSDVEKLKKEAFLNWIIKTKKYISKGLAENILNFGEKYLKEKFYKWNSRIFLHIFSP